MRGGQSATMVLIFVSIAMVIATASIAIMVIDSIDRSLITTGRTDWTTEALLVANRIVNSEDCLAYSKKGIYYDILEEGDDYVFIDRITLSNTIDASKISMDRIRSCVNLFTKEYTVLLKIEIKNDTDYVFGGPARPEYNVDPDLYYNPNTATEVTIPVKIIYDDRVSYGYVKLEISASANLFEARLV